LKTTRTLYTVTACQVS